MDVSKKIKVIALDKDIKLSDLGRKVGYDPTTFGVKLYRGIKHIDTIEKILDALDCELVIVDKKTKKIY